MSAKEHTSPIGGPSGNLSQTYCNSLDHLAKGFEPTLRNVGRWNLELMGLATRRAQAWLEIPSHASQCKTPQDLAKEQLRFWQTAAQDYAEGAQRLTAALGALAGQGLNGTFGGRTTAQPRDYITFTEPRAPAEDAAKRNRRAA